MKDPDKTAPASATLEVRCSSCNGALVYRRDGNLVTVIHDCSDSAFVKSAVASHDRLRQALEALCNFGFENTHKGSPLDVFIEKVRAILKEHENGK